MALQVIPERESATLSSIDLPYWVHDPDLVPGQKLSRNAAVAAASLAAENDIGFEPDDYSATRLSHATVRVVIQYRASELQPLTPIGQGSVGSFEAGFSGLPFKPERRTHSLGTIAVYNGLTGTATSIGTGAGQAPNFQGRIGNPDEVGGYDLTLPPETDYVNYVIPNGSFSSAYRAVVSSLLFKVNNGTFFGFAAGSVMLLRAQARRQTDAAMFLSFGFSTLSNGTRTLGGVTTGASVDGHDYTWVYTKKQVLGADGSFEVVDVPQFIYVERIWARADLQLLALPGS